MFINLIVKVKLISDHNCSEVDCTIPGELQRCFSICETRDKTFRSSVLKRLRRLKKNKQKFVLKHWEKYFFQR